MHRQILQYLITFSHVGKHYTYTLPQEPDQLADQERHEDESMCDDNSDGGSEYDASNDRNLESMPSFVQIR